MPLMIPNDIMDKLVLYALDDMARPVTAEELRMDHEMALAWAKFEVPSHHRTNLVHSALDRLVKQGHAKVAQIDSDPDFDTYAMIVRRDSTHVVDDA